MKTGFEARLNSQLPIAQAAILQRARGQLDIRVQRRPGDVTRLHTLRQQGSFRAIFPRPIHGNIEAVMINTAGGVTGGDRFSTKIHAHEDAHISVTTQAAERIYRATGDAHGVVGTEIHAEKSAQIFWMPQETILFDGARLRRLDAATGSPISRSCRRRWGRAAAEPSR